MDQFSLLAALDLMARLGDTDDEGIEETESVFAKITASYLDDGQYEESATTTNKLENIGEAVGLSEVPQKLKLPNIRRNSASSEIKFMVLPPTDHTGTSKEKLYEEYPITVFGSATTHSTAASTTTSSTLGSSEYSTGRIKTIKNTNDAKVGDTDFNFSFRRETGDADQDALEASFLAYDSFSLQEGSSNSSFGNLSSSDFNLDGALSLISSLGEKEEDVESNWGAFHSHDFDGKSSSKEVQDKILLRLGVASGSEREVENPLEMIIESPTSNHQNDNKMLKKTLSKSKEYSPDGSSYSSSEQSPRNNHNLVKILMEPKVNPTMQKILNLFIAIGKKDESDTECPDDENIP